MANIDLPVHRAVQEIIEMLHFATDKGTGPANKSLKLQIKTAGTEEENEGCLFHLKFHSSSTNAEEFLTSLTQTRDRELLPVLRAMQLTEDESHLCVQYLQSPGVITQKSFQVREGEDQSQLVLHCISTSTKSSKKSGVTIHIRILLSKHLMMLECQKMYKYLRLYKIFNPKIKLEFNMKIFENLCESDFSCTPMCLSGTTFEMCGDNSYFLRNTSYICMSSCVTPVCSEVTQLPLCEGTGDSYYPNTVTLQVVAHMNHVQGGGAGGRLVTCDTAGLIHMYLYGPEAVPIFPVLEDTNYNPLTQTPWNIYGLNIHSAGATMDDRFSSHFAALLESTVPQTHRKVASKFVLFIHVHFGIDGQTTQIKQDLCAWLHKNYLGILMDHQEKIDRVISGLVARLLMPYRETDKKTECYTKAIPNMAKSISYILSHSSNEEFRQHCFSLLLIENGRDVESEVTDRLWDIASKRCGVRGQPRAKGHSQLKTNSSTSDSVGDELTNPNHDDAPTGMTAADPGKSPAGGGISNLEREASIRESGSIDEVNQSCTGSSYTDLEHEMFTSDCMDQRQENFNTSSFTDFRNKISAGEGIIDSFKEGRQENIAGSVPVHEICAKTFRNSGFPEIGHLGHSKENRSVNIEHDAYAGSSLTVAGPDIHKRGSFLGQEKENSTGRGFDNQGQEIFTENNFSGLGLEPCSKSDYLGHGHETSAGSGFMVNTTPLIRTDKNSTQKDRCGLGLSNLADSSRTECYGDFTRQRPIADHWSTPRNFPSQVHGPSEGTQGRAHGDKVNSIHHGYDYDESQGAEMFHPADICTGIGPSGDAFNQDGCCNTSQQNQRVTNPDCFNDLGQHQMTIDNLHFFTVQVGDNYSHQGHDLGGQNHNCGADDPFNDVLENVQQWLDEF